MSAPVHVNSLNRARTVLTSAKKIGEAVEILYVITVEIENGEKPACVAEFIARVY